MSVSVYVSARDVRVGIAAARVEAIARSALAAERVRNAMLSITFVTNVAIARLNVKHLAHRGATDVISFGFSARDARAPVIGDIYIAPAVARTNAALNGVSVREEIARLVVHGTLHVLGYEHPEGSARTSSKMWLRQERLLARALEVAVMVAWLATVAALLLCATCALADGALLTAARHVETREGSTLPRGDARERTHRTLSIIRLFAQLACGAAYIVATELTARSLAVAMTIGIVGVVAILFFGETLPRELGDVMGTPALERLEPFVSGLELLAQPLVVTGLAIDGMLGRLLPAPPPGDDRDGSPPPLRDVVAHGPQTPREQRAILRRVFSLGDTEVQEVMVPRVDIIGIEKSTSWSEVVDRVRSSQHARIPVYDDTLDQVVGILYAKDLLAAVIADTEPAQGWASLVRPASFIPESKAIDTQLRDFKTTRTHIAIVVDEYGGTAGLLTIEDILEEIVGDIRDENDWEEPPIVAEENRRFWVSGRVTLDELSEALGTTFEDNDISTVGGLIFQRLGRVPRAGETLTLSGFRVVVERVVRRRIDRLYFERIEAPEVVTAR